MQVDTDDAADGDGWRDGRRAAVLGLYMYRPLDGASCQESVVQEAAFSHAPSQSVCSRVTASARQGFIFAGVLPSSVCRLQ